MTIEGAGWFLFGIIGMAIGIVVVVRPLIIARKKCYVCDKRIGIKGLKKKVHADKLWYHYTCWVDYARHEFIGEGDFGERS